MRTNSSTHPYTSDESCHWGLLGKDWIWDAKNGTCYQYSDWDKYAISNCSSSAVQEWKDDLRLKHRNTKQITIIGSFVGIIVGILLILSVVYWRRQKKRARARRHGKVEEVELTLQG
ncbi:uncharacterized protein M421DRAFT_339970 [Didymella exigua CBS 183.55]|uniref:Uncharacterized protein n=1 Tax=Didymella exigua CBS 183.55 TaxID=1150837 RepID=A0A6A5RTF5_9PLEO|nr:uncharacterized protein M421DRAFT_339970 [Didymella exigua CBS 183.55]KAF1931122.1 hypothetical protein M421DRAFT_339970 [Didymella exigua CBS 183.55]